MFRSHCVHHISSVTYISYEILRLFICFEWCIHCTLSARDKTRTEIVKQNGKNATILNTMHNQFVINIEFRSEGENVRTTI